MCLSKTGICQKGLLSSNNTNIKTILIIIFLLLTITLNAATYYVATTGNDANLGTISSPWLTWGKAASTAIAGDTVYFRGGTYTGNSNYLMNPNSGTAGNYICFFNYPGETPILDFNSYTPGSWVYVIKPYSGDNYLYFKGLTVKNFQQKPTSGYIAGIEAYKCNHLIFENLRFENIGGPCMGAYGCDEVYFINCDAIGSIDSLATPYPGNNGSGFAINTRVDLYGESMINSKAYFIGCRAWGNGDQGFAMSGQGTVEMTNCWSFDNGRLTGEGYGAKIGFGSTTDTNSTRIIKNCIFAINAYNGLTTNNVGGTPFNVQFYNNFVYRSGFKPTPSDYPYTGAGIWIASGYDEDVPNDMWVNNISYANEKGAIVDHGGGYYTHEYNSWDYPGGITVTNDDFISLDTLQLWYTRKIDGSLPDITFGKLAPGSDLIDAGTPSIKTRDYNISLPFNGDAPDLGWFESPGTSSSPTQDPPVYISFVIQNATPSRLEMTYSLSLANIVPPASAFTVKVNNISRTVSSVAISGTKVLLTLASPVIYGDTVTVAYTKPASNPLQTAAGGQVASLTAQNVTNNVAPKIPVYVNSVIEDTTPSTLEITFDTPLVNIVPPITAFTVKVNSSIRSVSSVSVSGNKVILTLSTPAVYDDIVTVAYTVPATNPIQTSAGGKAASFTAKSVTNNCRLRDNMPPVASLLSPEKSSSFVAPATIVFDISAYDPDGSISKVEIFNGNAKLAEITTIPYSYTWKDVPAGTYTVTVIATDNLYSRTTSEALTVIVTNNTTSINQIPKISILSPLTSASLLVPSAVTITADATDIDGVINKVEFFIGDNKIGECYNTPYTVSYNLTKAGTYEIKAVTTDNMNATGISPAVIIHANLSNLTDVINLYPNPNDGRFKTSMESAPLGEENMIDVLTLHGKTVYKDILFRDEITKEYDLSFLNSGVYIIMISNNKIVYTKKFIKM